MTFLFENNAESTLVAGISAVATSLTVQSGDGALFPNPSGGDTFRATLSDASNNIEIVDVTSRAGDVFTIVRGQEGTIANAYLSADNVGLRLTRDTLAEFSQNVDAVLKAVAAIKSLGDLTFNDNIQLNFGTGIDAEVYFDATQWNFDLNNDGIIAFRDGNSGNANRFTLDISSGDVVMTGTLDATGIITANANLVANAELVLNAGYSEDADTYGLGGSIALDTAAATYFHGTGPLTSIPTFNFTNPAASGRVTSFTMELQNAANFPPLWTPTIEWIDSGTEPEWTAGKDVVLFLTRDGGSTWLGFSGGLNFAV